MVGELIDRIAKNIQRIIVGKREVIDCVVIALLSGGHVLIEDVPGVGKTSLASSLAKSISCTYSRIQFTPDVLPSDITGFSMYNAKKNDFEYRPGVVMNQIILADEINRTSPKTQSALLEAMEEGQVSVDGCTYELPKPFMVLATQNPIEHLGTFPLPEAQLDRFFMKLKIGYPKPEEETYILSRFQSENPLLELQAVSGPEEIMRAYKVIRETHIASPIARYIVEIVRLTRNHPEVMLGISPRGSVALSHAAQAWACYQGRDYCTPDDVRSMALPVLTHRIKLGQDARLRNIRATDILDEILNTVTIPPM